jgi:succinate dehydrogenase cytochrome b556 subunit
MLRDYSASCFIRTSTYIPPSSLPPSLGRPVSPHVTIYKFPIGALTSIATRVTGGALTVGLTGVSLLALGGADVPSLMSSLGNSMVGMPAKVLFSFPLIYHYGSGLRHFVRVVGREGGRERGRGLEGCSSLPEAVLDVSSLWCLHQASH